MDAINTFYGHGDIPLAIQKPVDNSVSIYSFLPQLQRPNMFLTRLGVQTIDPEYPQYKEYLTGMTFDFPEDVRDGSNTTNPVTLCRTLLAASQDHSVTIANIGFQDNLYHLLHSMPDSISPLLGIDLVNQKVAELVVQANPNGTSFNLDEHPLKYAEYVLTHWPGLVTFVPDSIGDRVNLGAKLTTETDLDSDPVAYAFATAIGVNITHQAWDGKSLYSFQCPLDMDSATDGPLNTTATAMYYAVQGLDDVYFFDRTRGAIQFLPNGTAVWDYDMPTSLQRSIDLRISNTTFSQRIEKLLLWDPKSSNRPPCKRD
ncbi:MAG: hypothetical protein Q9227_000291 [Pyrenula ochraceoflavens]